MGMVCQCIQAPNGVIISLCKEHGQALKDFSADPEKEDFWRVNLLDFFARHAMSGFIASQSINNNFEIAKAAYQVAAAMMKERMKYK